ncbi:MAG TPA: shikimate kinase [Acidimicrobiales bacterium]
MGEAERAMSTREELPPSKRDRLFLIGMMGVGKTTVGRMVAAKVGWAFFDSDDQLLAATGRTAPEILVDEGDEILRDLECRVLTEAIHAHPSSVIAVAGGVVLSETSRTLLTENGAVVWLRASVATMTQRVGAGEGRPRLGTNPEAAIRQLYEARLPMYELIADVVIDVDDRAPDAVSNRVIEATRLQDRVTKYEN